jgi:hypothetical protein
MNQTQPHQTQQYPAPSYALAKPAVHSRSSSGNSHHMQFTQTQPQQTQQTQNPQQPKQTQTYNSQTWNSYPQGTVISAGAAQSAAETLSALGVPNLNTAARASFHGYPSYPSQTIQTSHSSSHLQGIPSTSDSTPHYPSTLSQTQTAYATTQSYGMGQSEDNRAAQRPLSVNSMHSDHSQQNALSSRFANNNQMTQQSHHFPQQGGQAVYNDNRSASPAQIQASQHLQSLQAAIRPVNSPTTMSTRRGSTQDSQPQANQYQQASTVDPSQVYDPWPEYRRKVQAAKEAKEATEAALRAEAEATVRRKMEAAQIAAEEARQAEKIRLAEQARKTEQARLAELAKKQKLKDTGRAAIMAHEASREAEQEAIRKQRMTATVEPKTRKKAKAKAQPKTAKPPTPSPAPKDPQEEIKSMMLKLREMNEQHPELLAQIWEQQRDFFSEQSPAVARAPSASVPVTARAPTGQQLQTPGVPEVHTNPSSKVGGPVQSTEISLRDSKWPPEKKEVVANEATAWLNAIPENRNNPIAQGKFLQILNQNPSYIELCEQLESMGLVVERALLARFLLRFLSNLKQSAKPSGGNQTVRSLQPPPLQLNREVQPNVGKRLVDHQTSPGVHRSPSYDIPPTRKTQMSPPERQIKEFINGSWQVTPQPSLHYPPWPNSRSPRPYPAASRSESLRDIDDGPVNHEVPFQPNDQPEVLQLSAAPKPPAKEPRSETPALSGPVSKASAARKRDISDIIDITSISDDDELPPQKKITSGEPNMHDAAQHFQRFPVPQQLASQPPPMAMMQPRASALEERLRNVNLVDTIDKSKALRRSSYNSATIARDVLLATGKHPAMPGLNSHLDILRTTMAKIGQAGHRIDGFPPPDLSTIRWDIIDPGNPVLVTSVGEVDISSELDEGENADDESEPDVDVRQPARATINRPTVLADGHAATVVREEMRPLVTRVKGMQKKFKFRNSHQPDTSTSTSTPRSRPVGRLPNSSSQTRVASGGDTRPTASPAVSGTPSGYTALRQAQIAAGADVVIKKGRPVGWRKALHMKNPGPSKPHKAEPPSQAIKHAIFNCKWKDCFAKLHNLETLRKHVHRIHGTPQPSGLLECQWEGCGKSIRSLDKTKGAVVDKHQYLNFAQQEAWVNHVEQSHIGPVSWSLGDGPMGGFSGKNIAMLTRFLEQC